MGTFTAITITGPNHRLAEVKLSKLPEFEGWDTEDWELVATSRVPVTADDGNGGTTRHYEERPLTHHSIHCSLHTKWSPDGTSEWAQKFTLKHPKLTVEVREEWDNRDADEPGIEDSVYRKGEWIKDESTINGEVPVNLAEMLTEAKAALTALEASYSQPSGTQRATDRLATVTARLIKGLS